MATNNQAIPPPTIRNFRDPTTAQTRNANIVNTPRYPGIGGFLKGVIKSTQDFPVTPPGGSPKSGGNG